MQKPKFKNLIEAWALFKMVFRVLTLKAKCTCLFALRRFFISGNETAAR